MTDEAPIEPDFESLFASAPGLYMVLDPGLRIVAATEAYLRETLTRRADILGRYVFDVFPDNPGDPSADAARNLTASFRRVLQSHVTDVMGLQRHDVRKPEAEGGGWEVRYWNATNSPVLKPDGSLAYIMHRVENVTELVLLQEQGVEQTRVSEALRAQAAEMKTEIAERRRAEEVLRESESRLRSLSEESKNSFVILSNFVPQLVWMCTPDGLNIYFNQRWVDYTGLTLEESYGRGWNTPFHPDDQQLAWNAWNKAVQTGGQYSIECRLRAADGSYRRFLIRGEPMRDISGGVLRWLGTCTDIEDLRQESEERLRLALAAAELGAWDYDPVTGALIWDARCKELFGLPPEVEVSYDMFLAGLHPDDRERANQVVQRSFDPASDGLFDIEYRTVGLRDGGVVRWVHATGRASFNTAGQASRFIGTVQDITGRKRAEEALRASEERFRSVADNMSEGLLIFDGRGTVSYQNPASLRIHGFGSPEAGSVESENLPVTWQGFDDEGHALSFGEWPLSRVARGERFHDQILRARRVETGQEFYASYNGCPIFDADGSVAFGFLVIREITEQRKAENALRASDKQFKALTQNLQSGVALIDEHGAFLVVNGSFLRMFDIPEDADILNVNSRDWAAWLVLDEHGSLLSVDEHPVRKASLTRAAVRNQLVAVKPPSNADLKWLLVSAEPILDSQGDLRQLICTYYDITDRRAAEEALRESEARFRLALKNAPVSVAAQDRDSRYIWAYNQQSAKPDQIIGHFDHEIFTAEEAARITAIKRRVLEEGVEQREQMWLDRPTGRMYVDICWEPILDQAGRVIGVASATVDLTPIKLAEEALRESERRLAAVMENLSEGLMIADSQGQVMHWNAAALAMFGYASMDECRRKLADPAGTFEVRPLNEDLPIPVADWPMSRVLRGEVLRDWGVRLRRLDQGWEKILAYSGWLIRSAGGERLAFVSVTDITARKQAEQALAASESRLRALLESASQGVVAVDERGRMILVNAKIEEMFGYTREELLGQPLSILLPERYRDAHAEHVRHYFASPLTRGMGLGLALFGRSKDGAQFPLEISLSCIEEGGTLLALALVTDITERKKAEERLWQAQKLESIGLLAGGVAHDFNNLLVGVIGNASLAREMMEPIHEAVELLDVVIRTGEQLAHLTRQMLAYAGKGRFLVEPLDLSDLLAEMSGLVQPSIPKKIALHLELEPHLPPVETDRGQLQQIFMNLVINAAEAIGSDAGLISVKTGTQTVDEAHKRENAETADLPPGRYVTLEVRDTGCGMDEATKAKIFDPFYSTKFTGRGLGLAAVAGIVRSHKGAIKVSSAPGKGSCFTVFFPAAQTQATVSTPHSRRALLRGTGTILVVDDEKAVRDMTKKALERYGYKVLLSHTGMDAIDMFKRHPGDISLVILDLSMPEMGGDEALPELRKLRPEVKVMISSGYSESETMAFFRGQLVSGFVQKPYTTTVLAEKVKAMLG